MERRCIIPPLLFVLSMSATLLLPYNATTAVPLLDKAALLTFKHSLNDPDGSLSNWLPSNNVCNFTGVSCNAGNRVTRLSLVAADLEGPLSPVLCNLTYLDALSLGGNHLSGPIPYDYRSLVHLTRLELYSAGLGGRFPDWIGHLYQLQYLDLGDNHFSGRIPYSIYNCSALDLIDLSFNDLSGEIPQQIGNHLAKLTNLILSSNGLVGNIPTSFSNLTILEILLLYNNSLFGQLRTSLSLDWLGHLSKLERLDLGSNWLSGEIPVSIYNCSNLDTLDLSNNALVGRIPRQIGNHLTKLKTLNLYSNRFSGSIPTSFSNMSILEILDLTNNSLSGEFPSTDVLGKLAKLQRLHMSYNHFVSHSNNTNLEPLFIALGNCSDLLNLEMTHIGMGGVLPSFSHLLHTNLSSISFENNKISGPIPSTIRILSNLTLLNLSSNLLSGTIPLEITQLDKLQQLLLSNNHLAGQIPPTLGKMASLGLLDLSRNKLSGKIPDSLGNLTHLDQLLLQENNLSGVIPHAIETCKSLRELVLSYNKLTGNIPWEISSLTSMDKLNLSNNQFQGSLPSLAISKMILIEVLDLSSNNFTNDAALQPLDLCTSLSFVNLSHNNLQGKLPESFGSQLKSLSSLDVSFNQLTGSIPFTLNATNLSQLNLSYNDFIGPIPTFLFTNFHLTSLSFLGNCRLAESHPGNRTCRRGTTHISRKIWVISSAAAFFLLSLSLVIYCMMRRKKTKIFFGGRDEGGRASPAFQLNFPRITYKELEEATDGFNQEMLIGTGGYGKVYKGTLRNGTVVAIKVLRNQTRNSSKSFNKECQVLKRIRHRNLIRIITACSRPDFKAVVLPYMANGSLDSRLYPTSDSVGTSVSASELTLVQRVNICSDVAEGMAYLHHHSPTRVVHGDLKPSNVLLNDDMTALVSDFGNARLLMSGGEPTNVEADSGVGTSTANMLWGSIGYMAPEYGLGSNMSTKGDVYSYGVLVLEMVAGKRPTDDMFGSDSNLIKWVKSQYHGRLEKVLDVELMRAARDLEPEERNMWHVAIAELIELGLLCTQDTPTSRPTMQDVADDLDRLKRYLAGDTSSAFASSLGLSSSTFLIDD